jgi:hypothetical protein
VSQGAEPETDDFTSLQPGPRAGTGSGSRRAAWTIVIGAVVLVGLGLSWVRIPIGVTYFLIAAPVLLVVRPPRRLDHPLVALATGVGVLISALAAGILIAYCLYLLDNDGPDWFIGAGLAAAVFMLIGLPVWIGRRGGRRERAPRPWNQSGLWEDD